MTPRERFQLGGQNPETGIWVREWYGIGSVFTPQRVLYQGTEIFGLRQLIATDLACQFILGFEALPKFPDAVDASELIPLLNKITEDHGPPTKGYIISHSCWLSSTELAVDEDTAVQGEFLELNGIHFGPMTEITKSRLDKWADERSAILIYDGNRIGDYL
jgi:hypothetical protein